MKKLIFTLVLLALTVSALPVFSQSAGGTNPNPPNTATIRNPLKSSIGNTIPQLLNAIVDQILIPIGAILAVLAFIWAGFKFVTAAGNETKIGEAKRALLYAAIGTAILLGAKVITTVLTGTIGSLTTP